MRKIEAQMNEAVTESLNWKSGNTEVVSDLDNVSTVFLHGNKIAEVGTNFIRLFDGGVQSKTTKSRLNALLDAQGLPGEGIFQKNFEWFVTLRTADGMSTVPFFSSMRLA